MNKFEFNPEKNDPQTYMEELKYGRFRRLDEEKKKIVADALAAGKDPEKALREDEERLTEATSRIRERQKEEAIENLEREMNEQFKRERE